VRHVRLYVEGGAVGRDADADFRRGWKAFLREIHALARENGYQSLEIVRGGGRADTFRRFLRHQEEFPEDLCALVVDSECRVADGAGPWAVVREREGDGWRKPDWGRSEHLFLMVQMLETWLVTDPQAFTRVFKRGFDASRLPPLQGLESRSKDFINRAIDAATRDCGRRYTHGQSHLVLEFVDPARVRLLTHGARLFDKLAERITGRPRAVAAR
jgi:hypothetical protein